MYCLEYKNVVLMLETVQVWCGMISHMERTQTICLVRFPWWSAEWSCDCIVSEIIVKTDPSSVYTAITGVDVYAAITGVDVCAAITGMEGRVYEQSSLKNVMVSLTNLLKISGENAKLPRKPHNRKRNNSPDTFSDVTPFSPITQLVFCIRWNIEIT